MKVVIVRNLEYSKQDRKVLKENNRGREESIVGLSLLKTLSPRYGGHGFDAIVSLNNISLKRVGCTLIAEFDEL